MKIALPLAILAVVVIFWAMRSCGVGCPDAIDHDAMIKIHFETPHYNDLDVWLSHNYEPSHWNPKFDALDAELRRIEEWSKTQNRCVRAAYREWIWFSRRELSEARFELKHQWQRKEMDDFNAGLDTERKERQEYEQSHKIPRP